jgi:hypothetical protein
MSFKIFPEIQAPISSASPIYTLFRIYHPFGSVFERKKNVKRFGGSFAKLFNIEGVSSGRAQEGSTDFKD